MSCNACNENIVHINNITQNRKRRHPSSSNTDDAQVDGRTLCWDAFHPYLDKCIPVKIRDVCMCRDGATPTDQVFPMMHVDSLPNEVLNKKIIVQCVTNLNCLGGIHPADLAYDEIRQKSRDIDTQLSLLSKTRKDDENEMPIFMGQEDQLTKYFSLQKLLRIDELIKKQKQHAENGPCMKTCCVIRHDAHFLSASQLPILDVDELEGHDSISLNVDGKVNHEPTAKITLSPLASLLKLPSYLLLGNPNNESNDISIQNINLWYAPQSCCTNVHYDDHDNLLIVTNGVKIVELSPPGCIQASGIYSTHANHPELLQRRGNNRSDEVIQRDIQSTLERKEGRTHIVTVNAGEALYIPLGWWHRVVSHCNTSEAAAEGHPTTANGCTAINVWFDYHHPSRQNNVPKHMTGFHLRQCSRGYFELHKDYATKLLLEEKVQQYFLEHKEVRFPHEITDQEIELGRKEWKEMNRIVFGTEELSKASISSFGYAYHYRLSSTWRATLEDPLANDPFYCTLEAFLLRIQLGNASHIEGLVKMWMAHGFGAPDCTSFSAKVLCKLSPEACYIITQAWEKHSGVNRWINEIDQVEDEAQVSHEYFFFSLRGYSDEVRKHFRNGVEEFYHKAWMKLSSAY